MLVSYKEVENAYQDLKDDKLFVGIMTLSILIGAIITIYKLLKQYQDSLEENEVFQYSAFLKLLKPLFFYVLIGSLVPFLFGFVESLFSEVEQSIMLNKKLPDSWIGDGRDIALSQLEALKKDYPDVSFWTSPGAYISYHWQMGWIKFASDLAAWCNQYLYSFVIAGRYLYLICLEMVAPIAIITSMLSETRSIFWGWLKQMFIVYLLIPGFVIAYYFSVLISIQWSDGGHYGFFMTLGLLALQVFLFKEVKTIIMGIFK